MNESRDGHQAKVEMYERVRICAKHLYHAHKQMLAISAMLKPEDAVGELPDPNQLSIFDIEETEQQTN